jgi:hypothetical protein
MGATTIYRHCAKGELVLNSLSTAVLVLVSATPALAISSYQPTSRSCADVQRIIAREGAVVLRYSGRSGVSLYDRYVSGNGQCRPAGYAAKSEVPTKDHPSCPVLRCRSASVFNPH